MRRQGKVVGTRARRSALSRRYIELERRSNKGEPPPVEGCPFCPPRRSTRLLWRALPPTREAPEKHSCTSAREHAGRVQRCSDFYH